MVSGPASLRVASDLSPSYHAWMKIVRRLELLSCWAVMREVEPLSLRRDEYILFEEAGLALRQEHSRGQMNAGLARMRLVLWSVTDGECEDRGFSSGA